MNQCFFCLDCCFCWHAAAFRGGLKPLTLPESTVGPLAQRSFWVYPRYRALSTVRGRRVTGQVSDSRTRIGGLPSPAMDFDDRRLAGRSPSRTVLGAKYLSSIYRVFHCHASYLQKCHASHLQKRRGFGQGSGTFSESSQPAEPRIHAGSGARADRQDRRCRIDFANIRDVAVYVDVQMGN